MKCQFDGTREMGNAPRNFNGHHVYNQVRISPSPMGRKARQPLENTSENKRKK